MTSRILAAVGIVALLASLGVIAVWGAGESVESDAHRVTILDEGDGYIDLRVETLATAAPEPTATNTPEPTPTDTPTEEPSAFFDAWHGPLAHDGLNVHEHGHEPPAWVMTSGFAPTFPEGLEAHQGFKFVCESMDNGVQSCLMVHILATGADTDGDGFSDTGARSVPVHSFQLWIMEPNGAISYWAESNTSGNAIVMGTDGNPAPLRTSDTGERPIILSVNDGACETWYSKPGAAVMDLGWTICGRHTSFDGTVRGGDGTFRTADWVIPANRLGDYGAVQLSPTLADQCEVQFGVCRFTFVSNSVDFGNAEPVN